jgi:hypothetical protein
MKSFERNDKLVIEAFQRGEFDYLEGASEISETKFFQAIAEKKVLEKLAATYPTPNKKHDVPLWVYIASDISMRFHGNHSFNAFPYVIRSGGMINAFGPNMGHKIIHPETKDTTLECSGFNEKNEYDRQTPCDQDHIRKMAKKTDAANLMTWFNNDVVGIFKQHHMFDPEGIFIGDATYLFVPNNEKYKGSTVMLFDKHNHPVDHKKLSDKEKSKYTWRRCYKLVSIIHTNRAQDFFLYAGLKVVDGKAHESPILYNLIDQFIESHGKGIMKKLILDRGFLDGVEIGRCKERGIDILIPARHNMDIYTDVVGLATGGLLEFKTWTPNVAKPIPIHKPENIRKREESRQRTLKSKKENTIENNFIRSEVAVVHDLKTFSSCSVPLDAVVNKEIYTDHEDYWVLLSTAHIKDPSIGRQEYALRTSIEERHRQLKCFSDLENFTSRDFNLIVNQVVFVLLTYSLLQWYFMRLGRKELNSKTRTRALELLRPEMTLILIYYKNFVAYLSPIEHQELVLTLNESARKKILIKTRRIKRSMTEHFVNPRAP